MNELVLEIAAFAICLFCVVDNLKNLSYTGRRFPKGFLPKLRDRRFIYLLMVVFLMASTATDVLSIIVERYVPIRMVGTAAFLNGLFFVTHTIIPALLALYIVCSAGLSKKMGIRSFILFFFPCIISELFIITNPFTGLIYRIDENVTYFRGPLMWMLYTNAAVYLAVSVVFFIMTWKRLPKSDRFSILCIFFIATAGVAIQGLYFVKVELFFDSIAMLCFLLLFEEGYSGTKQKRRRHFSRGFIVIIAFIFIAVITMNLMIIFDSGIRQTNRIGQVQVNNLKGELQHSLSEAENNLLRYAMGLEQLINDKASYEDIEKYVEAQKESFYELTDGNCFHAFAASEDWTVIPGFEIPQGFRPTERVWYKGAVKSAGQVFISEPYIDVDTQELCYSFSYALSDGKTVVGIDYKMSDIQEIVEKMGESEERFAMIVTDNGTLAGCSDERYQGEKIMEVLDQYTEVFERVKASREHRSFRTRIGGRESIIFDSETDNGWKLILAVDYSSYYSDIFNQMIMLGTIDFMMVAVIITFYLVSVNSQEKAEKTLASTESFIAGLSEDIKIPLQEIISTSTINLKQTEDAGQKAVLQGILESAGHLSERLENLFSYSNMLKEEMDTQSRIQGEKKKKVSSSSRYIRNGIVGIMITASVIGFGLCLAMTVKWGSEKLALRAQKYNSEVDVWMEEKNSILSMFSNVLITDPHILDDYDHAVEWLDDIAGKYGDITFAYVANPYNTDHTIIMNNGWVPDPDYRVEERQWYIDTERSGDGYSMSAPYFDAQTGLYCVTFSRAMYTGDGEFLGIFAIDCLLDNLIDVLDNSYTSDSYAFLVDRDGTIINHPDSDYEISRNNNISIEDTEYADAYHKGRAFIMREKGGRLCACSVASNRLSGFSVVFVQSWFVIYGLVFFVITLALLMIVMSALGVVTLINRFIRWQGEANERLSQTADKAVAAEKAKSRFLAQMSHEIRTPINAVLGMNEMILRESSDANIRDYAGSIRSAGRNLLGLINSILDFSKIEEGKMEIMPVKYDTASMIDSIINSILKRAAEKGLVFEAHVDSSLPSSLFGDDMRIAQIAVNLLTNAVKYTKQGRVDLFVEGVRTDEHAIVLKMRVKDTGIGIKPEDMGRLFESFTRLEENRNRNVEGTGLGMAIVNRLLDMMGSKLEVQSVYGEGSEFSFAVEQEIIDDSPMGDYEVRAREEIEENAAERHVYAPSARLLLVDDNDMNLKVAKNLLKRNGIEPDLALSGKEALDHMRENAYDLIMLDHMMPEMDGIETLQKAKEDGLIKEGCPVIALTANAVVGAREMYIKAGFDDYLSKPIEVKALENILGKHLPKEKTEYRTDAEEKNNTGSKENRAEGVGEGADIYRVLEENGIDTKSALSFCGGNEDFYIELLKEYGGSYEKKLRELKDALDSKDLKNYGIMVHSLKSTSKTIGASKLFEAAAELEKAADEGRLDDIIDGHEPLSKEYSRVVSAIASAGVVFEEAGEEEDDDMIMEFMPKGN